MVKNKITLNVLADISKNINNGGYFAPGNNILVVFNGSNIDLDSRILEIKKLKENDYNLSLGFSFMGEGILDHEKIIKELNPMDIYKEEDIFHLEDIVEKYPILIMPNLTMNTLSKVSLGMIDSFASNILWTYVYSGKDVYLDFNSVKNYLGKPSKNKAINGLIDNHIKTLKDMGAVEVKAGNYLEKIVGNKNEKPAEKSLGDSKKKPEAELNKEFNKVITEGDLYNISKDTVLNLPKGTIITPLAKDRAREMGIKIEIER